MTLDFGPAFKEAIKDALLEVMQELRASLTVIAERATELPRLEMLGVEDVVKVCNGNVTAPTVRAWCKSGRLVAKKVGRGYLIERTALTRFLSALEKAKSDSPEPDKEVSRILGSLRGK